MTVQTTDFSAITALRTVAVNGAYNASRALSKWLKRGVRLTSDGFTPLPISTASTLMGGADTRIAAIHLPLAGDLSGHILLAFPEDVAFHLVDILLGQTPGTTTSFTELEQSCLQETGNIVSSAYANSLARWLRLSIEPRVPMFIHDMASAILDPLLAEFAAYQDEIPVAATEFLLDGQRLQWWMLLLPSNAALGKIEEQCRTEQFRRHALQTIAINGAFQASRSVSKWLRRGVKIATEGFSQVRLDAVGAQFDPEVPIAALHLSLSEQLKGHALVATTVGHALQIADILLQRRPGESTELGEDECSALSETANIVASSFINSWANWLEVHVKPLSPTLVVDLPGALFESVLAEQALQGDEIFVARTDFIVDEQWLEWVFMLLPSPSAMRLIESSCR